MNKDEAIKIFNEVKENHRKLDSCKSHNFSTEIQGLFARNKYQCSNCNGTVDWQTKHWYEKGREHERGKTVEDL
jgi:hypothetical protein